MKKLKFAVIGAGHIGKRHAQMVVENPHCELIAIIDTDESIKKETPFQVPFFTSLASFLSSNTPVDIINICTPNYLHCSQAIQALDRAHVVLEKPMGLSTQECQEVLNKSKETNKEVFCVMQNRYSPPSKFLKSLIAKNQLGEIYQVQVNCFWNRDDRYYYPGGTKHKWKGIREKDGGVLYTQFSHFIDTIHWLFGPLTITHSEKHNYSHSDLNLQEDTGAFFFHLPNKGTGSFNYSTSVWDANMESSISIIGEKGSIKIAGQYMNEVVHCHIKDYKMPILEDTAPPNDYGTYKGSAANHHFVIQNIVDVLLNKKPITTSAEDGLEVVKLIEKAYML